MEFFDHNVMKRNLAIFDTQLGLVWEDLFKQRHGGDFRIAGIILQRFGFQNLTKLFSFMSEYFSPTIPIPIPMDTSLPLPLPLPRQHCRIDDPTGGEILAMNQHLRNGYRRNG